MKLSIRYARGSNEIERCFRLFHTAADDNYRGLEIEEGEDRVDLVDGMKTLFIERKLPDHYRVVGLFGDGKLIGAALIHDAKYGYSKSEKRQWIWLLSLAKGYCGKGYGRHFVRGLESRARRAGYKKIGAGVWNFNHGCLSLFHGLGYSPEPATRFSKSL